MPWDPTPTRREAPGADAFRVASENPSLDLDLVTRDQMSRENSTEGARDTVAHIAKRHRRSQDFFDSAHLSVDDTTWNDVFEVITLARHVQSKSMGRHPPRNTYANGREFSLWMPDPGKPFFPMSLDAELRERADENLLECAQIGVHIFLPASEIKDGITDDLSWAVKGDITTAIRFDEPRSELLKPLLCLQEVLSLAVLSDGIGLRMLDEEQEVGEPSFLTPGQKAALKCQDVFEGSQPQVDPEADVKHEWLDQRRHGPLP